MNDTIIVTNLTMRQQKILSFLSCEATFQSSQLLDLVTADTLPADIPSLITIKRELDFLTEAGWCLREGQGRSTGYRLSPAGRLLRPFDVATYVQALPDTRTAYPTYTPSVFSSLPRHILSEQILQKIDAATLHYRDRLVQSSPTIQTKELERFVIELSWKSSAIEGNTYTLLDTERLIREGIPATGHEPAEAQMILNHKYALEFVLEAIQSDRERIINQRFVEQIHELLIRDLEVGRGLRSSAVGITGSAYTPLDNKFQIREALEDLYHAVEKLPHPIEKAMLLLAGISYIQPFEDGNKRTARLISNAILLANEHAPLSYRSVDIEAYRGAMLVFYEQLSIAAVRDIFISQYEFSTKHYLVHA